MSVSHDPHGAQALASTLNGDLLWASTNHLYVLLPVVVCVLAWQNLSPMWQSRVFLPLFALAVTVSVEVAGVYVVFATLISTPLLLCRISGHRVVYAVIVSISAHIVGLVLAAWKDYSVGPTVVLSSIIFTSLVILFFRAFSSLKKT